MVVKCPVGIYPTIVRAINRLLERCLATISAAYAVKFNLNSIAESDVYSEKS